MESKVVITGFGLFRHYTLNPSWEAVKLLEGRKCKGFDIVTKEIPVEYEPVDALVPQLWKEHNPILVIHVGVSHLAETIVIESKAHRFGYNKVDAKGLCCTGSNECSPINEASACLSCNLNICQIRDKFNSENQKVVLSISTDAGRYLCEYIFFKSLSVDCKRTIFLHVPPVDQPYSIPEISDAIFRIAEIALEQVI